MSSRSSYASAPVVLRKLLQIEPIRGMNLDELLASDWTPEQVSALILEEHDLRISATSIRRWREQ